MSIISMEYIVNKMICYRPHPHYSNIKMLESLVDKKQIEYPDQVSILTSIVSSAYAVGSYTTVLNQACFSGKGIVLDDVTFNSQCIKLKEHQYSLAYNNYVKLSELQ